VENFTKEELKNFIIGISMVGLLLLSCIIFKLERNIWADTKDSDYIIYATFNRTDGLVVGDKVRLAGMDIGRVVASVLDDAFRAKLTLQIRSEVLIPDDSSAAIVSSGLMGNKYIEIEPGGSEDMILPEGEFSYTQDAMVLEELIDRVLSLGKAKHKSEDRQKEENANRISVPEDLTVAKEEQEKE